MAFQCAMGDGFKNEGFTSIEIVSSEEVAGIPTDETRLNPAKTDQAIKDKILTDVSGSAAPPLIDIKVDDLEFDEEKGIFRLSFPFKEIEGFDFKKNKIFRFPLAFPTGIIIIGNILSFEEEKLNIEFMIEGKVEGQPLIWEQTVISFQGEELFVLPGLVTKEITTEGFKGEIPEEGEEEEEEEKEEEELESDQEQAGESDGETSSDGSESEELTGSDQSLSSDLSKGGEEEEEPISKEDALAKAEIFISFRQLGGFEISGSTITFFFYALTSQNIEANHKITLFVKLIGKEGMDEEESELYVLLQRL